MGEETPYFTINKYQPCNQLIAKVMDLYSEGSCSDEVNIEENKGKIITIYSPVGGAGKSTLAVAITTLLAHKGKKVLYFNYEAFSSTSVYFSGESQYNLSNLFYLTKNKKRNISLKLEAIHVRDQATEAYFIHPPENILEWEELNEEEIQQLLTQLQTSGIYDYIVMDLASNIDSKQVRIFNLSNWIIAPFTLCPIAKGKMTVFLEEIKRIQVNDIMEKLLLIINRDHGHYQEDVIGDTRVKLILPEEGELWVKRGHQWLLNTSSPFAITLKKLLKVIDGKKGEEGWNR